MTPLVDKPRRRKWLKRTCWGMFALLAGVVGFWCWSYWSALAERDTLIAEIRAKGEPVWWGEVADKLLAEPNEGTGAELYLKAVWALGGETNPKGPCVPSKKLTDELEQDKFKPRVHPLIESELKLAEPAFAMLEKGAGLPPGRVIKRLRTESPISIFLSEVVDIRRIQRMLHWQSFDALAKGDAVRAYHGAWLALAVTQQLANEPFAIAQLNRLIVMSQALDQLTMCFCWAAPPDQELKAIDALLADWEMDFAVSSIVKSERAVSLTMFEREKIFWFATWDSRIRRNKQGMDRRIEDWLLDFASSPIGRPIVLRTQVQYLQASARLAPSLDNPLSDHETFAKEAKAFEESSILNRVTGEKESLGIKWLVVLAKRCRTNHQKITLARLALRLRRYHDQHGRFPQKLDELCDAAMPKIRLEWFKNQPIVYKPSAKGFRLEVPASILPEEERHRVKETPILSDYGLEIELKTIKPQGPTQ